MGQRVLELQSQYNEAYETVLDAMREAKIQILNEEEYSDAQREFATNYFKQRIRAHLVPIMISEERPFPDLKDGVVYFVVALTVDGSRGLETQYALISFRSIYRGLSFCPRQGMGTTSRSSTMSFGMNSAACSACSDRWKWWHTPSR